MTKRSFKTGVYIDGSNLFWAQKILLNDPDLPSWRIDFKKLKGHLDAKYSPLFYKYYATVDVNPSNEVFKKRALGEARFQKFLGHIGYDVVSKPLKYIIDRKTGKTVTKGDTDVELTQGVNKTLNDVELVCLVTGDSDFIAAIKDWYKAGKYIQIYSFKHMMASELTDYCYATPGCSFTLLDEIRSEIELMQ